MPFSWVPKRKLLTPAALTVRAQTRDAANTPRLNYNAFFRQVGGASMKISEATSVSFFPAADRRGWSAESSKLREKIGPLKEASFIPIEQHFLIGEEEMQELLESFGGNTDAYGSLLDVRVPDKVNKMVDAIKTRCQIDAYVAWALGVIRVKTPGNPNLDVNIGFEADRYETAVTDWDDSNVNAFEELLAFLRRAIAAVGPIEGVKLSSRLLNVILEDAPKNALTLDFMGVDDLARSVQSKLGIGSFRFAIDDRTYDADLAGTKARYWPETRIAAIPVGRYVGEARRAPVVRAAQIAAEVPEARVDRDGVAVYYTAMAEGKALKVSAQLNEYHWPAEQLVFVHDTGITVA